MGEEHRPAAVLCAGVDGYDQIASRSDKTASRVTEFVAGLLEGRAVELGGALRRSSGGLFVVELPDPLAAIDCARHARDATRKLPVRLRMGIHVGDIWAFGNEALGEGVEVAARLQALAAPGAIVLSAAAHSEASGRIEERARSLGTVELKSLGRSIEAYEIAPPGGGAAGGVFGRPRVRVSALVSALPSAAELLFSTPLGSRQSPKAGDEEAGIEVEREAARVAAFRSHAAAFAGVNGAVYVVWLLTLPHQQLWFLYPLGAWGIGLAHHFVALVCGRAQRRESTAGLTAEQRRTLRRLHREESGFAHHLTAFSSVSVFLFVVNMISSPGFPWFILPAVGWSVGLVSHRLFYSVRRRALVARLRRLGVVRGEIARVRSVPNAAGRLGPLVDEAYKIKDSLVRQLRVSEPLRSRFGDDLAPLLERYVGQISGLNERRCELEGLLATLSEDQIGAEIRRLEAGRDAARSTAVRQEYDRALTQHEQQRASLDELRGQQEILDLRIKGSVLALKRIEMDVARMKGLETAQVMSSLREKSEELSRYLEDLKAGYSELEG